jgi:hypothetical protein
MMAPVSPAHPLGIRDARARTFWTAIVIAAVAHLPFTPIPFILRLLALYFTGSDTSWDYQDDRVIIPISLVEDTPAPQAPTPPPEPTATAASEAKPPKRESPRADAGAEPDAGPPDGGKVADAAPDRRPAREAGVAVALADGGDGGGASLKDTLALVGSGLKGAEGKNNVELVLWFSTIREHRLGALIGGLLTCNEQWHDFMGDLVDPLQDFDAVGIFGPRFTDTSKVTIYAQHRMEDKRANQTLAKLGAAAEKKGMGGMVRGGLPTGMVAARVRLDRADRIALTHRTNMIIVTPPEKFEALRDMPPFSLPAGKGQALSFTIVNPWRPAERLGLHLPHSLSEMRLNVYAATDGGADIKVEFDDQELAMLDAHARNVGEQVRSLVNVLSGGFGGLLIGDISFEPRADRIYGELHLSSTAGALALGALRPSICPRGFDGGAPF